MLKRFTPPLTGAQLGTAMEAVHALDLYRDGRTMHVLTALFDSLVDSDVEDSEPARVADGNLPVTVAQVDAALEGVREAGLARAHLTTFKRARDLLATAESERTAADARVTGRPATKGELDAFLSAVGVALAAVHLAGEHPGRADASIGYQLARAVTPDMSTATRDALNQLTKTFGRALEARRKAEEAQPASRKFWQPGHAPY